MASTGPVGGSQLDVQSLVSQLVAAERAPLDRQVSRDVSRVTTQISAVGTLMGAMSQFRTALSSLKSEDAFATRQAVSADDEVFKATAGAKAAPGTYNIDVEELATAQQISSKPFVGGADQVIGTGTLTLSLGAKNFSITIDSQNSSLAKIRDAINASDNNPGVRATLVHGEGGSRLVLTSAKTGAANEITVAQSGGNGGLADIAYSAASPANYTEIAEAKDAVVNIANVKVTSATNTINDAIDGVTLTLVAKSEDEPTSLTVTHDRASVSSRVNNFVTAYNALASQISRLRSYDATTQVAGPMLGDSLLSGIEGQLRRTISDSVDSAGGNFNTLASIGITTQADGKLAVDSTKLNKALDGNFEAVGKLFGSEQGIGAKLFAQMDDRLKTDGALDARSKNLVEQQRNIDDRKQSVDVRMAAVQKRYLAQFTRLDSLLSQLQTTSSYLSQQIDSLSNLNKR